MMSRLDQHKTVKWKSAAAIPIGGATVTGVVCCEENDYSKRDTN